MYWTMGLLPALWIPNFTIHRSASGIGEYRFPCGFGAEFRFCLVEQGGGECCRQLVALPTA